MAVDSAPAEDELRRHADSRIEGLRVDRHSYWQHWRDLATFVLPRRYKWLVTPNEAARGSPINNAILDNTGTVAARTLAAGMVSGMVSAARPWFKLKIAGWQDEESDPVSIWLDECQKRMLRVFARSNFYGSTAVGMFDMVVFGTACQIEYEDYDNVVNFYNPALGEFYLGVDNYCRVDTIAREYVMTVKQVVEEFELENCSDNVKQLWGRKGGELDKEIKVRHLIEPNSEIAGRPAQSFKWRELYWEEGSPRTDAEGRPAPWLRKRGYYEWPAQCPRWDTTGNDAYGRSPAMDALGDIKQLQQETKRKAQSIDKMTNPPMLADAQLRNQPMSLLPGGTTFVAQLAAGTGMRPVYQVNPPIGELAQDLEEIRQRIRNTFFNDLFMMISQLDTVRSAAEIYERKEEKMILVGPVVERYKIECLDKAVTRTFNIMHRRGLFPPPPQEIQGREITVQYVSFLADNQRAAGLTGLERLAAMAGNLSAVRPDVLDVPNWDEFLLDYANRLDVSPKVLNDMEAIMAMREQRAQQTAQAQGMQEAGQLAAGAKVLSETDVGGGQNALNAMLYG
jgi:hypothetical protein